MLCCTKEKWRKFVDVGDEDEASQQEVCVMLTQLLDGVLETAKKTLEDIEKTIAGQKAQRELLARRWKQIEAIVAQTMRRL